MATFLNQEKLGSKSGCHGNIMHVKIMFWQNFLLLHELSYVHAHDSIYMYSCYLVMDMQIL